MHLGGSRQVVLAHEGNGEIRWRIGTRCDELKELTRKST